MQVSSSFNGALLSCSLTPVWPDMAASVFSDAFSDKEICSYVILQILFRLEYQSQYKGIQTANFPHLYVQYDKY